MVGFVILSCFRFYVCGIFFDFYFQGRDKVDILSYLIDRWIIGFYLLRGVCFLVIREVRMVGEKGIGIENLLRRFQRVQVTILGSSFKCLEFVFVIKDFGEFSMVSSVVIQFFKFVFEDIYIVIIIIFIYILRR